MEGGRKWEDLNPDCLANVFGRVGVESLYFDVPFVCKSWYKATRDSKCWERLVFPEMDTYPWFYHTFLTPFTNEHEVGGSFPISTLMKSLVKCSRRSATLVALPCDITEETLDCVADECPALKMLFLLSRLPNELGMKIPSLVKNWKHLEVLRLGDSFNLIEILAQISIHCNKFVRLLVSRAYIGDDEASAIVSFVPNIKHLYLRNATLERRENLVTILKGCKELVKLDVRDCVGFEGDDEILKLASNIAKFKFEGSRAVPEYDFWDDHPYDIEDGSDDGNGSD